VKVTECNKAIKGISTGIENFRPNPIDHVLAYGQKIASPPVVLPKIWKKKCSHNLGVVEILARSKIVWARFFAILQFGQERLPYSIGRNSTFLLPTAAPKQQTCSPVDLEHSPPAQIRADGFTAFAICTVCSP
jgi:hypothetical protein